MDLLHNSIKGGAKIFNIRAMVQKNQCIIS